MTAEKTAKDAINKAIKSVRNDIFQILLRKGISKHDARTIVQWLPMTAAIKSDEKGVSSWCFLITEENRNFDHVLVISVVADAKNVIDCFLIPTAAFTGTNFFILSKDSLLYHSYKIESEKMEETVEILVKEYQDAKPFYAHYFKSLMEYDI